LGEKKNTKEEQTEKPGWGGGGRKWWGKILPSLPGEAKKKTKKVKGKIPLECPWNSGRRKC